MRAWSVTFGVLTAILLAGFQAPAEFQTPAENNQPACSETVALNRAPDARRGGCVKDWTVLIFMQTEGGLSPYAYWDLYEMEAGYAKAANVAGSGVNTDVVVQWEDSKHESARRIHVFQSPKPHTKNHTASEFALWTGRELSSPVLQEGRAGSFGRNINDRFQNFLAWGIENFPSQHYMIVLWGHGVGWNIGPQAAIPLSRAAPSRRVLLPLTAPLWSQRESMPLNFDSDFQTTFDTMAIGRALATVSRSKLGGRPLDLFVSDACLMQTVEVATEFAPAARFVVGSAQILPYLSLPYRYLFYEMNTGYFGAPSLNGDEAKAIATSLPGLAQDYSRQEKDRDLLTTATVDSDLLRNFLSPSMENLAEQLAAFVDQDYLRATLIRQAIQTTPGYLGGYKDVGFFLSRLENAAKDKSPELLAAVNQAREAVRTAVVSLSSGDRYAKVQESEGVTGFSGVSVWLPEVREEYVARKPDFQRSLFYGQTPSWSRWLDKVYGP